MFLLKMHPSELENKPYEGLNAKFSCASEAKYINLSHLFFAPLLPDLSPPLAFRLMKTKKSKYMQNFKLI